MSGFWIQLKIPTFWLSVRIKMSHDPAFLASSEMVPKERQGFLPKRVLLFGADYIINNLLCVSIWSNQCFHSPFLAGCLTQAASPQLFITECLKMPTLDSLKNWEVRSLFPQGYRTGSQEGQRDESLLFGGSICPKKFQSELKILASTGKARHCPFQESHKITKL